MARIGDFYRRDRLVFSVVVAHVPLVGCVGALCGHFAIGVTVAALAAALCYAGYASARGTRLFRAYGGALLMLDSRRSSLPAAAKSRCTFMCSS
jgi:hypothetical protein